jgi:hypothetical protein
VPDRLKEKYFNIKQELIVPANHSKSLTRGRNFIPIKNEDEGEDNSFS